MTKKNKYILNSILVFSVLSLLIAYFIQYYLGHKPCNLCIIQRYPYFGAIVLISLLFFSNKFEKIYLYIIFLLFIFGTIVSFYHFGIEQGFFTESFVCDIKELSQAQTKEDLLKELTESASISCKDVTYRLFGLSLASINTIISSILSVIIYKILKSYDTN